MTQVAAKEMLVEDRPQSAMTTDTNKAASSKGAISIRNVTKVYDPEGVNVMAVDNCSLEIAAGQVCMIVGPSGCGKPRCSMPSPDSIPSPPAKSTWTAR